jgi:hypothetical protein
MHQTLQTHQSPSTAVSQLLQRAWLLTARFLDTTPGRLLQDESVSVLLNGLGTVITALNKRAKPYLPQINGTIKWRMNHKLSVVVNKCSQL